MIKTIKTLAWIIFLLATAILVYFAIAALPGNVNVSVNGQHLEGAQKIIAGSAGLIVAGIATLAAIGIAIFATVGSGILIFACLALVAFILIAVAMPFLLFFIIPILLLAFILMSCRDTPSSPLNKRTNENAIGNYHPNTCLSTNVNMKEKEVWVAYLLWFFLGLIGVHKFYVGKFGWGILYLFTGGLFLIGWIVDLFTIPSQVRSYNEESRLWSRTYVTKTGLTSQST